MRGDWRDAVLPSLALFGSTSTLLCCALPAVLISLGAGAVMAGLTTAIPGLMWLSAQKNVLFIAAGALLAVSSVSRLASTNRSLPDRPREGGQLSAAAPSQCLATQHVMAGLRLRRVLRLCLGARVLLTIWKTTGRCK